MSRVIGRLYTQLHILLIKKYQNNKLSLFIELDILTFLNSWQDVSLTGHYSTGDVITSQSASDAIALFPIKQNAIASRKN